MKLFVTGGTGYIGAALVRQFVAAGHEVMGLARSADSQRRLAALGALPVAGELGEPARWIGAQLACDVTVHAAMDATGRLAVDAIAVRAMLEAARATGAARRFVYTSGCMVVGETHEPAGEDAPVAPPQAIRERLAVERLVLAAGVAPLSTAVIRPGWVFGGHGGVVGGLFDSATRERAAVFVGDGANRWPLVHLDDLAALYQALVERWHEGVFHAVTENARVRDLAEAASRAAGAQGRTRGCPLEAARDSVGPFADAMCIDQVLAAPRSREVYGWQPRHAPFVESAAQLFGEWKES